MTKLDPRRASLCSMLAIATALMVGASPAAAQALLGTVTSSSGVGTITSNGATDDHPGDRPAGGDQLERDRAEQRRGDDLLQPRILGQLHRHARFRDPQPRRADASAAIRFFMGGDVSSTINGQVGGTVYFYSPNGIIIGGDASFNVGSLGLTTLADHRCRGALDERVRDRQPERQFRPGQRRQLRSDRAPGRSSTPTAPAITSRWSRRRSTHRGTIRTDGAAALVGASAATITFRTNSLFDIAGDRRDERRQWRGRRWRQIERNNPAIGGNHAAYLVAVPANNAMTMIVQNGSALGFDIAGSAFVEDNVVVLSSGHDVAAGAASGVSAGAAGSDGDIDLIDSSFTSRVSATAADRFFADANAGTMRFSDDLTVRARIGQIEASGTGTQFLIDGDLDVDVSNVATANGAAAASAGFNILSIGGATMTIAGSASIDASARGGYSGMRQPRRDRRPAERSSSRRRAGARSTSTPA